MSSPFVLKATLAAALLAAPLVAPALLAPLPAQAQTAKQNFTLVNRTGYELGELYVAPARTNAWGRDVLGKSTIEDGDSAEITFNNNTPGCLWDIKVVYTDDDSSALWRNIDLCRISTITIRYNRNTDVTSATFD
jgi:hypothetical protein